MYFKSLCLASSAQKASCHSTPGHYYYLFIYLVFLRTEGPQKRTIKTSKKIQTYRSQGKNHLQVKQT